MLNLILATVLSVMPPPMPPTQTNMVVTKPMVVKKAMVVPETMNMLLSWQSISNVSYYEIKTSYDLKSWTSLGQTTNTGFLATTVANNNQQFYYVVGYLTGSNGVVNLAWDNMQDDVIGYHLYYGLTNVLGTWQSSTTNQITVSDLQIGSTYYFAVTSVNSIGLESQDSQIISYIFPPKKISIPLKITKQ